MSGVPVTTTSAVGRIVSILRVRNFTLLWMSSIFSGLAEHMSTLILAWLVLQFTDSPWYLGVLAATRWVGMPLGIVFGTMADRLPRRKLLLAIQILLVGVIVGVLFVLSLPNLIIWPIFALTLAKSIVSATHFPVRLPLIADTVSPEQLPNALPLSSIGQNATSMVGPFLGGLLLSLLGARNSYGIILVLGILSVFAIALMRSQPQRMVARGESGLQSVVMGFSHVRRSDILLGTMLLIFLFQFTALALPLTLMPVFARDVLGTDSTGLGLLMLWIGFGEMLGSGAMASHSRMRHMGGGFILFANVAWHGAVILFSVAVLVTPSFWVAAGLLVLAGLGGNIMQVVPNLVLLRETSPEFRGRVIGLRGAATTPLILSSLYAGALASVIGAPMTMIIICLVGIAFTGLLAVAIPGMWKRSPAVATETPPLADDIATPGEND